MEEQGDRRVVVALPPDVAELLRDLRPEEVKTLKAVIRMGDAGVRTLRTFDGVRRGGRVFYWIIITLASTFVGSWMFVKAFEEAWIWAKELLK